MQFSFAIRMLRGTRTSDYSSVMLFKVRAGINFSKWPKVVCFLRKYHKVEAALLKPSKIAYLNETFDGSGYSRWILKIIYKTSAWQERDASNWLFWNYFQYFMHLRAGAYEDSTRLFNDDVTMTMFSIFQKHLFRFKARNQMHDTQQTEKLKFSILVYFIPNAIKLSQSVFGFSTNVIAFSHNTTSTNVKCK